MARSLQHRQDTQRITLSPARARKHRSYGPEARYALTNKLGNPSGAHHKFDFVQAHFVDEVPATFPFFFDFGVDVLLILDGTMDIDRLADALIVFPERGPASAGQPGL